MQYPLRGGTMFNQVAVFESPTARAGLEDWGTPDELDAAFEGTCEQVQQGLPLMWRDKWWRMFDRDPIMTWVHGRIALLGDAALAAYDAVRPEHCRRVLTTGRVWGELWHLDGLKRLQRNALLRARDTDDYTYTEWIYGPTTLFPEDEPPLYPVVPLDSVPVEAVEEVEEVALAG